MKAYATRMISPFSYERINNKMAYIEQNQSLQTKVKEMNIIPDREIYILKTKFAKVEE